MRPDNDLRQRDRAGRDVGAVERERRLERRRHEHHGAVGRDSEHAGDVEGMRLRDDEGLALIGEPCRGDPQIVRAAGERERGDRRLTDHDAVDGDGGALGIGVERGLGRSGDEAEIGAGDEAGGDGERGFGGRAVGVDGDRVGAGGESGEHDGGERARVGAVEEDVGGDVGVDVGVAGGGGRRRGGGWRRGR